MPCPLISCTHKTNCVFESKTPDKFVDFSKKKCDPFTGVSGKHTVRGKLFQNVSFEHTNICNIEYIECNFLQCNFEGAVLRNVDFIDCDLGSTNFSGAHLEICGFVSEKKELLAKRTCFNRSFLNEVSFLSGCFDESTWRNCHFNSCKFEEVKAVVIDFGSAQFLDSCFSKSEMTGAVFSSVTITNSDDFKLRKIYFFEDCKLDTCSLSGLISKAPYFSKGIISDSKKINFQNCDMSGIILDKNELVSTTISKSSLKNIQAEESKISESRLTDSLFEGGHFANSSIINSLLTGSVFVGCDFTNGSICGHYKEKNIPTKNISVSFDRSEFKGTIIEDVSFIASKFNRTYWNAVILKGICDFTESEFNDSTLSDGVDFGIVNDHESNWILNATSFRNSNLCNFIAPKLMKRCAFDGAILNKSIFKETELNGSSFRYVNGNEITFYKAELKESSFVGADLSHAIFYDCVFTGANFSNSAIRRSVMYDPDDTEEYYVVQNMCFDGVDFSGTIFYEFEFARCSFVGTSFKGAVLLCKFINCNIEWADFEKAFVEVCCFSGSVIRHVQNFNDIIINHKDWLLFVNDRLENDAKIKKITVHGETLSGAQYCPNIFNRIKRLYDWDNKHKINSSTIDKKVKQESRVGSHCNYRSNIECYEFNRCSDKSICDKAVNFLIDMYANRYICSSPPKKVAVDFSGCLIESIDIRKSKNIRQSKGIYGTNWARMKAWVNTSEKNNRSGSWAAWKNNFRNLGLYEFQSECYIEENEAKIDGWWGKIHKKTKNGIEWNRIVHAVSIIFCLFFVGVFLVGLPNQQINYFRVLVLLIPGLVAVCFLLSLFFCDNYRLSLRGFISGYGEKVGNIVWFSVLVIAGYSLLNIITWQSSPDLFGPKNSSSWAELVKYSFLSFISPGSNTVAVKEYTEYIGASEGVFGILSMMFMANCLARRTSDR